MAGGLSVFSAAAGDGCPHTESFARGCVMGARRWIGSGPRYPQGARGGRLRPGGWGSWERTRGDARQYRVRYRRPFGTDWEDLDLDTAMDMIADRVIAARRAGWQWEVDGARTRRTLGFASLGGATLDNEENYLIKKLFTALGAIQVENQARI